MAKLMMVLIVAGSLTACSMGGVLFKDGPGIDAYTCGHVPDIVGQYVEQAKGKSACTRVSIGLEQPAK